MIAEVAFNGDRLQRPVLISAIGHGVLLAAAIWGAAIGRDSMLWGEGAGGGSAATVKLVSSASIPLPPPAPVVTTNKVANEEPGLHYSEAPKPQPKPAPEKAVELPGKNARRTVPSPPPRSRQEARLHRLDKGPPPGSEIPYGAGGPVQGPYGMFRSDAGTGGFAFDQNSGDFGSRFGWYVTAIRNRISSNWLQGTVDPNIRSAPRLYVTFQIQRDGQIMYPQLTTSSGIPSLDRSALRAIIDSNPMPPLPPEYRASSVAVEFWFDFRR
ncbi:MAG: TonB C-terminal domain-containing protein [Acidobacteria bacterium]|nr:TonB C-terminal domain-containing protein [Acidobacteriota bacterium]